MSNEPKPAPLMKPSIGRTVLYMLSAQDAEEINRRRTNAVEIRDRMAAGVWSIGAQAHIGNAVSEGDIFPMVIVRMWAEGEAAAVNGKVLLDGNDDFWATSRIQIAGDAEDLTRQGRWFAPPRV